MQRGDDVASRFRDLVPLGVDGLVDAALLDHRSTEAIRDDGSMAVVRGWDGQPGRGIKVHQIWVQDYAENSEALRQLVQHVERGELTPRVARTFPAEEAAAAHRQLERGGTRGRIVLEF
ncbi:zinc-binding dehydrogenase [Georgenia ruanii]|uniref:Zinc-binding dehydrogenase n=1 Tax=Georgenia ruanii TaxID=348442 RepID=A0A7J9UTV0_9MICO|nr:zinc-binding dehydrogenase [Georgenia ruanii]MPV88036.1 zinc-binding dehydrogenase [Georgenia ruanii]